MTPCAARDPRPRSRRGLLLAAPIAAVTLLVTGCAPASTPVAGASTSSVPSASPTPSTTSASGGAASTPAAPSAPPAPATPTSTSAPSRTASPAVADAVVRAVPESEWQRIVAVGAWHPGCPVTRTGLRRVEVGFHGFDGAVHRGVLVVNADVAASVAAIFTRLFDEGFPIHRMQPIEAYGGDDAASMAADNTSAYNCRRASQANAPATASPHANGRAVDVNPYENPWIDPRCGCFEPDNRYGRQRSGTGVITRGGVAWTAFTRAGWTWQDNATIDYQHFDTGYPSRPLPSGAGTSAALGAPLPSALVGAPTGLVLPTALSTARQVVTVRARGSWATVTAWQRTSTGWHSVARTSNARIGAHGLVAGTSRRQGTDTTPAGTFALTHAFGILASPGTRLPYHRVGPDDWWVEDNRSPWYNTMRRGSAGGFSTSLPESDVNGSEHLIRHRGQYDYAVVIDYNLPPYAVRYRGAGIFLHLSDGHATAGCVAVPRATLVAILRWLTPSAHPVISIG